MSMYSVCNHSLIISVLTVSDIHPQPPLFHQWAVSHALLARLSGRPFPIVRPVTHWHALWLRNFRLAMTLSKRVWRRKVNAKRLTLLAETV